MGYASFMSPLPSLVPSYQHSQPLSALKVAFILSSPNLSSSPSRTCTLEFKKMPLPTLEQEILQKVARLIHTHNTIYGNQPVKNSKREEKMALLNREFMIIFAMGNPWYSSMLYRDTQDKPYLNQLNPSHFRHCDG